MKRMIVARGGKRGKTAGRGGKGQTARAGNKRRPEWRDIIKKLPKLRGRGVNSLKSFADRAFVVNLSLIQGAYSAGQEVTPSTLVEKGLVATWSGRIPKIKILGDGEITTALKVSGCLISESAEEKIKKAGGTVTLMKPRPIVVARVLPTVKPEEKKPEKKPVKAAAKPATKKEPAAKKEGKKAK